MWSKLPVEWINRRFEFFNRYTLNSLLRQSNRNFDIWVMCGSWRKKATDRLTWHKKIKLMYDNAKAELEKLDTHYIAITRIDSDDLMHVDGMEEVINVTRTNINPNFNKMTLMFNKNDLIFYAIAGTAIGFIAEFAGASLTVTLLTSLLIPPILLQVERLQIQ